MSLEKVFSQRVERAARVIANPDAGPTEIRFSSEELGTVERLADLHERFPRKRNGRFYLYQLSFEEQQQTLPALARKAFRTARATKARNMSRDNAQHPDSHTLYVGTSESMHDRFRTHLGRGNGVATWALYLSAWAVPLRAKFLVEYYQFTDTIAEDVELIEGVLWDSLRPLFGKKGGK